LVDNVPIPRLLPLYFPRDKPEEEIAALKLPADVGDENGETVIDERKIRIKPLPAGAANSKTPIPALADIPLPDSGLTRRRWGYKYMFFLVPMIDRNYLKRMVVHWNFLILSDLFILTGILSSWTHIWIQLLCL